MTADEVVASLGLTPHPEGGAYRETFRHVPERGGPNWGGRGAMTAIYYLLRAGVRSHWHRVDAAEIWHFYAGAPLALEMARAQGDAIETVDLGPDLAAGQTPQAAVPAGWWQAARSRGAWTLVGCTVGPAFEFAGFELAPKNWTP
jgi:predicted cupin superfamily sugar epimerase